MDGVMPGDILRLNRATLLGSRDWTLKGGANNSSPATITASKPSDSVAPIMGNTSGLDMKTPGIGAGVATDQKTANRSHKAPKYLDERLFTCRAVVMGTESEPMRVMEKTKQRQRHTKTVRSKHKYTILKIREIEVNGAAEV
jgi:large subunit ribosomal protein L21